MLLSLDSLSFAVKSNGFLYHYFVFYCFLSIHHLRRSEDNPHSLVEFRLFFLSLRSHTHTIHSNLVCVLITFQQL